MSELLRKLIRDSRRLPLRVVAKKVAIRCHRAGAKSLGFLQDRTIGLAVSDAALLRHVNRSGLSRDEWIMSFRTTLFERRLLRIGDSIGARRRDDIIERIIVAGELALQHTFDLLGSGPVIVDFDLKANGREGHRYAMPLSENSRLDRCSKLAVFLGRDFGYKPIDWHIDFVSGFRWSGNVWHANVAAVQAPGSDIKVPWELSRGYHLVTLAKCYSLTKDDRYAREIAAQIVDFILANPVGRGPNWVTPMEIAIRAANWLVALSAVAKSPALETETTWMIAKSLYDHARFIRRNLEWSAEVNGNHYTANLLGLYFVGMFCSSLPGAARWAEFARAQLEQEIVQQTYDDGCNFEGSTSYHRLVTEMFFFAALLGRIARADFSDAFLGRLEAQFSALDALSMGSGVLPQIGDNDSARFVVLDSLPVNSLRVDHYAPVADWFFSRSPARYSNDVDLSPLWFLCGDASTGMPTDESRVRESCYFAGAGWAVLRSGEWECLISCGPNGQKGNGGHGHNDKLSCNVVFGGHAVIVDPGTYLYTAKPELRNLFRSTAMHSTPQLNNIEQNELPPTLFTLPDSSHARIVRFDSSTIEAQHTAYGEPVKVEFQLLVDGLRVAYRVGPGTYSMRWLLHPDVQTEIVSNRATLRVGSRVLFLQLSAGELLLKPYRYSAAYGVVANSQLLEASFTAQMSWLLTPAGQQ